MKQEIAKIWVDALRSSEYTQGKSYLKYERTNGGYKHCCLGVLCELYDKNNEQQLDKHEFNGLVFFDNSEEILSSAVKEWAGLQSFEGLLPIGSLAGLNDCGWSFQEIADIIEQNIENL